MNIEKKAKETIEKYGLLKKTDDVLVALSGGKDSTSTLYILHKLGYNVSGLMINLHLGKWSEIHLENMRNFCDKMAVPFHVVDLKEELGQGICFIKAIAKKERNLTGCSVCGVIKKYLLNKYAKKLKADVIATGHNLDDETQTVLMNFLKGNVYLGVNSSPATAGGENQEGFVQRIKPMFFVPESEIKKYALKNKFEIMYDRCPCAIGTYRVETRQWINNFTDKEKMKIVGGFQKIIPRLKREHKRELKFCKKCGEPCSNELCNACRIFESIGLKMRK